MRKAVTIFLLILTYSVNAQDVTKNQTGTISGNIYDSIASAPIEFVNIALYRKSDSLLVQNTVTDSKGNFTFNKIPFNDYYLLCSSVGYLRHKISNLSVSRETPLIKLRSITLRPSISSISEVTVSSEKSLVDYSLDKKTINVDKDLNSQGGSALDVLRNVPSVTVDADNHISMRGSTKVNIQLDGHPSKYSGLTLEEIPSSDIEAIEIISNPSAKYNPEGMSGIINIKLKKSKDEGLNGTSIIGVGSNQGYNGSVNMNYKRKRNNYFISYLGKTYQAKGARDKERIIYGWDSIAHITENTDFSKKYLINRIRVGTDLYLNAKNTLTLSGMVNTNYTRSNEDIYSIRKNINYFVNKYYEINNQGPENDIDFNYSLNYKRTFAKEGEELTVDGLYSTNNITTKNNNSQQLFGPTYFKIEDLRNNMKINNKNVLGSFQINFANPLKQTGSKYEIGFQNIVRNSKNYFDYYRYQFYSDDWIKDTTKSNRFIFDQQTYAVYALYAGVFKEFKYQAGVRLEQTFSKSLQEATMMAYTNNYLNLFPSFHLTKQLDKRMTFQFGYSRRINRPDKGSLNPFIDYTNPQNLHYGNQKLKPEFNNNFDLELMNRWAKTTFIPAVFYRTVKDDIRQIIQSDSNGVIHTTFDNIASGKSYGLEMILEQKLSKRIQVIGNFSYFKTVFSRNINQYTTITNDNYSWIAKLTTKIEFPKKIYFQFSGYYNGPKVTPQGIIKETYSFDIALRKKILKDKGTLAFRLSDVMNTQRYRSFNEGEGFIINGTTKRMTRIAFLSFTYRLNAKRVRKSPDKTDEMNTNYEEQDME